jgi:phage-related protein
VTEKFDVLFLEDAREFIANLEEKERRKILFNIDKAKVLNDPRLFKKLNDYIWEFRTEYNNIQYRLLAFWDKTNNMDTFVIATHGFIKKKDKVPQKEIEKAENLRNIYFKQKR